MGQINEFKRKNMKIEINCSQELLEKSKYCGTLLGSFDISGNCWIALAVQEVFPNANVGTSLVSLWFEKFPISVRPCLKLPLPQLAQNQIRNFDACRSGSSNPDVAAVKRLKNLQPFTFEIELTEEQENILLENISLPDLTECFAKSKHLTLTV